jgi:hypothetical protein
MVTDLYPNDAGVYEVANIRGGKRYDKYLALAALIIFVIAAAV